MNFNATIIIVFLSFIAFMFAMKQVYFDPMFAIQKEREDKKKMDRDQAQAAHNHADTLQESYDSGINEARKKSQETVNQALRDARQSASEKLATARQDANQQIQDKITEMQQWRQDAYEQLSDKRQELKDLVIHKITQSKVLVKS